MSFFISDALAEGAATANQPGLIEGLLPFVILFVVFYFLLIRPQQKKVKEHRLMVEGLNKGDEVVTNGGIAGRITEMADDYLSLEIAANTVIKLQRSAVITVLPKGTLKNL
jgi:preprotein translocase subunit YajC